MLQFDISAEVRTAFGKGAGRRLRAAKKTPAILYGKKIANVPLQLDTKEMTKILLKVQDQNAVITLSIDGIDERPTRHVMVKEVQVDPIRDTLVHVDFYEIDLETPLALPVPLAFSGKAKGVDMGGEMRVVKDKVVLEGLPLDIPDDIPVDVSGLGLNDKITCGDLAVPDKVSLVDDPAAVCVWVEDVAGAAAAADEETEELAA